MKNNIIVSIGESDNNNEKVEDPLIQSITNVQAKVLGYQVYADTGNSFNNFVLQIQDIIYSLLYHLPRFLSDADFLSIIGFLNCNTSSLAALRIN